MKQDLFAWPEVEGDANIHGPLSFAIPSSTAGYAHMHANWGKLPLEDVIAPAIALAKRGLPQDWYTTLKIGSSASVLRRYPESARIYLPDGLPPVAPYQGSPGFFRLGALADTLEHLGRAGLRDQYEGDVAAAIMADVQRDGRRSLSGRPSILPGARPARHPVSLARPYPSIGWRPDRRADHDPRAGTNGRCRASAPSPDADWYVAFGRAMKQAYKERLGRSGRRRSVGC